MNVFKTAVLSLVITFMFCSTAQSEAAPLKGIKLGFGFDRGLGVVGSLGDFNGFIGNDGASIDYIFNKEKLKTEDPVPMYWYVGAGGYGDWDGDVGIRLPVGGEIYFAKNLDAYAQLIPRLRVNHSAKFGLDFAAGVRYQF